MRRVSAIALGGFCLLLLSCTSSKEEVVEMQLKNHLVSLNASAAGNGGGMGWMRSNGQYGGDIGGGYGSNGGGTANGSGKGNGTGLGGATQGAWANARGNSQSFLGSFHTKYKVMLAKYPRVQASNGDGTGTGTGGSGSDGAGGSSSKNGGSSSSRTREGYGFSSTETRRALIGDYSGSDALDCNIGAALREIILTSAMPRRICVLQWTRGAPFGEKYLMDW